MQYAECVSVRLYLEVGGCEPVWENCDPLGFNESWTFLDHRK